MIFVGAFLAKLSGKIAQFCEKNAKIRGNFAIFNAKAGSSLNIGIF